MFLNCRNHKISDNIKIIIEKLDKEIFKCLYAMFILEWSNGEKIRFYSRLCKKSSAIIRIKENHEKYYKKKFVIKKIIQEEKNIINKNNLGDKNFKIIFMTG